MNNDSITFSSEFLGKRKLVIKYKQREVAVWIGKNTPRVLTIEVDARK